MIADVNHIGGMIEVGPECHLKSVEILQQGIAGEGVNAGFFILTVWMGIQKMTLQKGGEADQNVDMH